MLVIKPSKKTLIGLICVAILICCIDGYLYYNRASRLAVLQAEYDVKDKKLQDSKQIAQRLSQVENRYSDVQSQLGVLEQGVSSSSYIPSLLKQLESLGKSNNLKVVGVRPELVVAPQPAPQASGDGKDVKKVQTEQPEPYNKINIDIDVSGHYWNIVSFIDQLNSFPKIITVREMNLAPAPTSLTKQIGAPLLNVKISTSAFILKQGPANVENKPSFGIIKKIEEHQNAD